jgi:hypothetical protein
MFTIEQTQARRPRQNLEMKAKKDKALDFRCLVCGARVGQKCEQATGFPRTAPHLARVLIPAKKASMAQFGAL